MVAGRTAGHSVFCADQGAASGRVVEAASNSYRVVESGEDDEDSDGVSEVVEQDSDALIGISGAEKSKEDQGDFEERGGFAKQTRRKRPIALDDKNDRRDDKK